MTAVPQQVMPLPGRLDDIPVFNSNSPEVVQTPGILVSTFPGEPSHPDGAHLNYPIQGRFDVFFHHIANGIKAHDSRTLYIACLVGNAAARKVHVRTLAASSYLSQPDAPFVDLAPVLPDQDGRVYAGPGDRVALDFLRNKKQKSWRSDLVLAPGEQRLLFCLPIPVSQLSEPLNGRSGLMQMDSSGPVYLATLAMFGNDPQGHDPSLPPLDAWQRLLEHGVLAGPRDVTPTAPEVKTGIKYGRVAGVDRGSAWHGLLANTHGERPTLGIKSGETISYAISTVNGGTLGTEQVQSARMIVRYPDTAYQAHGNYGVLYDLTIPIENTSTQTETVKLTVQTPIKAKSGATQLTFYDDPPKSVFFRGAVRLRFRNRRGRWQDRYVHLVEKQGERMDPILQLTLKPKEVRVVRMNLIYPADSTPPQVLTISGSAEPPA